MVEELEWQRLANCVDTDPEQFFTDDTSKIYPNEPYLKRICNNCEVKKACLNYSLKYNVRGWWGGTTESQRTRMRWGLNIKVQPIILDRD